VHPKKGLDTFFKAYAAVWGGRADAPAIAVAGPGADEPHGRELQALAAQLGLGSAVHWLGLLTGDAKWGALRASEAFVLFSHQENFGMAVVESLACGRPVLLSDRIDIWREIAADGAGIATPDTLDGAVAALRRWQAMDTAQRTAMARAAGACFQERFAVKRAAAHLIATLQAAVAP